MRKIIPFLVFCGVLGCQPHKPDTYSSMSIEEICKDVENDVLTVEEVARWDSMNEEEGYVLIRGAERNLDTIVNHLHMIFITEP